MNITIPPAAMEAGARALARYNCEKWDNDPDRWRAYFTDEARACGLAMLEAWPGMIHGKYFAEPSIILPLPQDNSDEGQIA
jgi:hypothetical protein